MIQIKELDSNLEGQYERFLLSNDRTLIYSSLKYRTLLLKFLQAKSYYAVALRDSGEIVGALPSIYKIHDKHGAVINSLPFYGSNGGLLEFQGDPEVRKALLSQFKVEAARINAISSTLITSPFDCDLSAYNQNDYTFQDERIGQFTTLDSEDALMEKFHYKTRNTIRKAAKSEVKVEEVSDSRSWDFLKATHTENILSVGGLPKPDRFFDLIPEVFLSGKDYRVYLASHNGEWVAALLVLYFNKTVEYFTPVIVEKHRHLQPLSLIIFRAMNDAWNSGYRFWNWGGTWISQAGVYNFKKRWGTEDHPYYYYTRLYDDRVRGLSKEELLREFSYFYLIPFGELTNPAEV